MHYGNRLRRKGTLWVPKITDPKKSGPAVRADGMSGRRDVGQPETPTVKTRTAEHKKTDLPGIQKRGSAVRAYVVGSSDVG